ncbi:MAG: hypothetical protein RLZZ393_2280 [Pseudomonadota bacterium]
MKSRLLRTVALYLLSTLCQAQLPPGITQEMIATTLPEEGAPRAVPGRYAVMSEATFGRDGLKLFRPAKLDAFPTHDRLPVVVWGNGGCAIDNARYTGFLETIASHGFLVVTTTATSTPAATAPSGGPTATPRRQATAADLSAAIDWALRENNRADSPLFLKVDTMHVAVMGQSCGGRLSLELGADPRVGTIGVFNMGLQPAQFGDLAKLHGPVLLINGHDRDFMAGPSRATFEALDRLPVFYGSRHGAGHTATAYHAGGGEFANVAANWVRWQFKKDRKSSRMFLGEHCGLCTNGNWDVATKRLDFAASATAVTMPLPSCDRECLRSHVTQVLWAFVKHDVSKLPVAYSLRVTEDAIEKPLKDVSLIRSVTGLHGYRQDFIDVLTGMAGASVVVEESGAPILLVLRLKVLGNQITELELVPTRSRSEGLIFNLDGLKAASAMMNYAPRPEQRNTREEVLQIALKYPEGFTRAETFEAVNLPFAADAYRHENGQVMAGPDCRFAKGCENIATQPLTIFKRLGPPITRVVLVDERMGIAWLRLAWGVQQEGGDQLTAFEAFKVFDGKMHAVEAFIRILPIEKRKGGWD